MFSETRSSRQTVTLTSGDKLYSSTQPTNSAGVAILCHKRHVHAVICAQVVSERLMYLWTKIGLFVAHWESKDESISFCAPHRSHCRAVAPQTFWIWTPIIVRCMPLWKWLQAHGRRSADAPVDGNQGAWVHTRLSSRNNYFVKFLNRSMIWGMLCWKLPRRSDKDIAEPAPRPKIPKRMTSSKIYCLKDELATTQSNERSCPNAFAKFYEHACGKNGTNALQTFCKTSVSSGTWRSLILTHSDHARTVPMTNLYLQNLQVSWPTYSRLRMSSNIFLRPDASPWFSPLPLQDFKCALTKCAWTSAVMRKVLLWKCSSTEARYSGIRWSGCSIQF